MRRRRQNHPVLRRSRLFYGSGSSGRNISVFEGGGLKAYVLVLQDNTEHIHIHIESSSVWERSPIKESNPII